MGENIKYPQDAQITNAQGTVYLSFTINEQGAIEDAQIDSSPMPSLGAEALRVLQLSKDWSPAIFNGENVSYELHIPIKF